MQLREHFIISKFNLKSGFKTSDSVVLPVVKSAVHSVVIAYTRWDKHPTDSLYAEFCRYILRMKGVYELGEYFFYFSGIKKTRDRSRPSTGSVPTKLAIEKRRTQKKKSPQPKEKQNKWSLFDKVRLRQRSIETEDSRPGFIVKTGLNQLESFKKKITLHCRSNPKSGEG